MEFYNDKENAICFLVGDDKASVTFSKAKYANKIRKLAEKYPSDVTIIADGPENSGYLYAFIPVDWIKIQPKREVSDEQRERARNLINQRMARRDLAENATEDEE